TPAVIDIWHKISTVENPKWTALYHDKDPNKKAFGGKVIITMNDGTMITDELERANAHPAGARPFTRSEYIHKFETLTTDLITSSESDRFLDTVQRLPNLSALELFDLNVQVKKEIMNQYPIVQNGIF
nr:hypothetical protein [Saprospiraceae bacterium]